MNKNLIGKPIFAGYVVVSKKDGLPIADACDGKEKGKYRIFYNDVDAKKQLVEDTQALKSCAIIITD